MKLFAVATLVATLSTPAFAKDVDHFRLGIPQDRVPGVGLVKLHGVSAQQLMLPKGAADLKALSARTGVDVELIRPVALGWAFVEIRNHGDARIPNETDTLTLLARLARDPSVQAVSDDKWMRALAVPNDPGLPQMWHLDIINAEAAWDVTQGLSSQRVGVIDTGLVRSHEDVGSRAVAGFDFVSSSNTGNDGNGRDNDFDDPGDSCGSPDSFHGTHVAGTIGASTNNAIGVSGLNWNAGLVIGRALGRCGGDIVDIGEAAIWMAGGSVNGVPAVGANKVSVMNLSLGSDSQCSSFEQDVVNFVDSQGVVFVAAAGNSAGPVGSPANCNNALTVAAHGPERGLAPYSSFGSEVDIVAPGGDFQFGQGGGVLSAVGPNTDFYTFQQGTSMAAPHVTGSISLMQALDPTLSRAEIVTLMQQNGTGCTGCQGKIALVLDATLEAIDTATPPPPPPPVGDEDDLEENDSFDSAIDGPLCGDTLTLFAAPADQDWFVLETLPGEGIDISITTPNGADLDLYVLTGPTANDIVAASETATGNEAVHVDADGTTLRVLVNPFVDQQGNENTGGYTISIDCVGGPEPVDPVDPGEGEGEGPGPNPDAGEDAFEENDTIESGTEMFCDETKDGTLRDVDFFVVEVRDGDTLQAQVSAGALEVETAIMTLDGTVLAQGTATSTAGVEDLDGGVYAISLTPVGGVGTYRLRALCKPALGELQNNGVGIAGGCASTTSSSSPIVAFGIALVALGARRRRRS